MRSAILALALGTLGACGSGAPAPGACSANSIRLQLQLELDSTLADTVTVEGLSPVTFTDTFHFTPPDMELQNNFQYVDVTFPGAYPVDKLVSLLVTASAANMPIATESVQVHTLPVCSAAFVTLISGAGVPPIDAGAD